MTATMSRSAAIREAKSEVKLMGPMGRALPGGYKAYRVSAYDHGYKAHVEGRDTDYASARRQYKEEVVRRALAKLGWEDWQVQRIEGRSWEWAGQSVERVVREMTQG